MADPASESLERRTAALLEPGDIELNGAIVHTAHGSDEDLEMMDATIEVGDLIADAAGVEEWYVYSGNDDPEFSSNQHQGLTMADDFIWECQQLLRDGTFDLVFYYTAKIEQTDLLQSIREAGYEVTGVRGD